MVLKSSFDMREVEHRNDEISPPSIQIHLPNGLDKKGRQPLMCEKATNLRFGSNLNLKECPDANREYL